jgi:hypothetical protein
MMHVHCDSNKLGEVQSAHEVDAGVLRDQLADVEDGAAPGILGAGQVEVVNETKDSSVAETLLVKVLEEEDEAHLYIL